MLRYGSLINMNLSAPRLDLALQFPETSSAIKRANSEAQLILYFVLVCVCVSTSATSTRTTSCRFFLNLSSSAGELRSLTH